MVGIGDGVHYEHEYDEDELYWDKVKQILNTREHVEQK